MGHRADKSTRVPHTPGLTVSESKSLREGVGSVSAGSCGGAGSREQFILPDDLQPLKQLHTSAKFLI